MNQGMKAQNILQNITYGVLYNIQDINASNY